MFHWDKLKSEVYLQNISITLFITTLKAHYNSENGMCMLICIIVLYIILEKSLWNSYVKAGQFLAVFQKLWTPQGQEVASTRT